MTVLVWDQAGARRYESGIDRGVLYLPDGSAVPWNGLTSVTEGRAREVKSYYMDGVKYLDRHVPGSYSAKLQAFTYPDELESLLGNTEFVPGVVVHDQRAKLFNLSYRTLVGNDLEGMDHGYKIHIVYNVMASPSDFTYNSLSADQSAETFEWDLTGTPNLMFGIRPTSHISLDSRKIDPAMLDTLEEILYGSVGTEPNLPNLVDLLSMVETL